MRGEGAVLEGVEGVWIVETFRREQRLREVGCGIHKTDADEMDGQAYLWLRLRRMGRHIICGWGLRVIKMRQLSPLGGHGLSIKIWRIVYGWALCSSTQEQSKEISHRASISGSIRYMRLPLFSGKRFGEALGVTLLCSHSMLQFFHFSSLFPSSPQQDSSAEASEFLSGTWTQYMYTSGKK